MIKETLNIHYRTKVHDSSEEPNKLRNNQCQMTTKTIQLQTKENFFKKKDQNQCEKVQIEKNSKLRQNLINSKNAAFQRKIEQNHEQENKEALFRYKQDENKQKFGQEIITQMIAPKKAEPQHKFSIIRSRQHSKQTLNHLSKNKPSQSPTIRHPAKNDSDQIKSQFDKHVLKFECHPIQKQCEKEDSKRDMLNHFKIKSLLRTPTRLQNDINTQEIASKSKNITNLEEVIIKSFPVTFFTLNKIYQNYIENDVEQANVFFETKLETIITKNDDVRYKFLISKTENLADSLTGIPILGVALYSFDTNNFKTQRMLVHHISAINNELLLKLVSLLQESIFKNKDRFVEEIFLKLKHKKNNGEYESIPKVFLDQMKTIGWKWKMVMNELDGRFTILWNKRTMDTPNEMEIKCVEPFKFIFCGFISNDPDLVFLNKKEINSETILCSDLMRYFGRLYDESLDPSIKQSESRTIRSSLLIKSQVEDFRESDFKTRPQEDHKKNNMMVNSIRKKNQNYQEEDDKLMRTFDNLEQQRCDDSIIAGKQDKTPTRPIEIDEEILADYTQKQKIDNSRLLLLEIGKIFDSKLRDKHLKKIHFQTAIRFHSILNTFRLALRLPSIMSRVENWNSQNIKMMRLSYFYRLDPKEKDNSLFFINSLDPNFKLLVCRFDGSLDEITLQQNLKNTIESLNESSTGMNFEDHESSGFLWIPQCKKSSMFEFVGDEKNRKMFCKFEIHLGQQSGDDLIQGVVHHHDLRIKSEYLLGILKIDVESNKLNLIANFKMLKSNFYLS